MTEIFTHTEGCHNFKHVWCFKHRSFTCEIVVWNDAYGQNKIEEGALDADSLMHPKWNSYFYVNKKRHSDLFSKVKWNGDYYEFNEVKLHGGQTFCRPEFDTEGRIVSYKIGNDFHHIWNTPEEWNFDFVKSELVKSLDDYLDNP